MRLTVTLLLGLAAAGCTHPPVILDRLTTVETASAPIVVRYQAKDTASAAMVQRSLGAALARLAMWGAFQAPVEIDLVPDHASLEQVVRRHGYGWLRAWARYRDVVVQSPRTWSIDGDVSAQMTELLTHELTHCLMYQLAAPEEEWTRKGIPIWFREGMASFTANQGYRRGGLEVVGKAVLAGEDPLGDAEALYRDHSELVYGAAHHAFGALVERGGVANVREVLAVMHAGASFEAAFAQVYAIKPRDFQDEVLARARQWYVSRHTS